MGERLKTEALIAAAMLAFGVLALPIAVYLVGTQVVGEYAPGAGPLDLAGAIWSALGDGELAAWLLIVSPYAVVQLARLAALVWRSRRTVRPVTDLHADR